jgi:uncharacterized protein (TIGR03435 family)
MKSDRNAIDRSLARFSNPSTEQVESAVARVWKDLVTDVHESAEGTSVDAVERRPAWRSRWTVLIAAAAVLVVGILLTAIVRNGARLSGPTASVETVYGKLYRVSGNKAYSIAAGERIAVGETVRSDGGAVLALADQSRVEMGSGADFTVESAADGARIRLNRGTIIVTAQKQRGGHLYVETKDVTVSVVGTVFVVSVQEEGSRVAVVQGEVRVLQAGIEKTLLPGNEVATNPALQLRPLSEEVSWSRYAQEHMALFIRTESGPRLPLPRLHQSDARPEKFDVASLHVEDRPLDGARLGDIQGLSCTGKDGVWRAPMSAAVTSFSAPRGRCVARYSGVQILLASLYDIPWERVVGAVPNWRSPGSAYEFGFRIEAVADDVAGVTTDQLRQMMKALLIERFKLKVRVEMRDQDGYALTVLPDGAKMQPVSQDEAMFPILTEGNRQQVIKGKTTMKRFAEYLSRVGTQCTVVDKTGLNDTYDYTLTLSLVLLPRPLNPSPLAETPIVEPKGKKTTSSGVGAVLPSCGPLRGRNGVFEYNPSVKAALQQQLGLSLDPQKVLVEHLVIDEVSEPAVN